MGTAIIGLILCGTVILVLKRIIGNIKGGKFCSCGGDCKSCGGGCSVSKESQGRGMDK